MSHWTIEYLSKIKGFRSLLLYMVAEHRGESSSILMTM